MTTTVDEVLKTGSAQMVLDPTPIQGQYNHQNGYPSIWATIVHGDGNCKFAINNRQNKPNTEAILPLFFLLLLLHSRKHGELEDNPFWARKQGKGNSRINKEIRSSLSRK